MLWLEKMVIDNTAIVGVEDLIRKKHLSLFVNGFMEPFTKELPLEYAVELNRLIKLEMDDSVG